MKLLVDSASNDDHCFSVGFYNLISYLVYLFSLDHQFIFDNINTNADNRYVTVDPKIGLKVSNYLRMNAFQFDQRMIDRSNSYLQIIGA